MSIVGWTDVDNTFELIDDDEALTHSTRDGVAGYVVGGPYATSSISRVIAISDPPTYGTAVLTYQRANIGNTDDWGRVRLEALDAADATLDTEETTFGPITTENVWQRGRLFLSLPEGTTQLRVTLFATRNGMSGNSAAAFDDFSLRVHRSLEPSYVVDIDFTERPQQPTPRSWQRWHGAWPNATALVDAVVAHGVMAVSGPRPISSESIVWSDAGTYAAVPFLGNFGIAACDRDYLTSGTYREAFGFTYQGPHIQLVGNGTKRRGNFASDASFAVRVVLKARQYGSGAGIVGCRSTTTGIGWGISLTATGAVRATLQGVSGAKTATSSASIADGAPHQVVMVYDATAQTLRVYVDRRGYVETSTASSMGEFSLSASLANVVRIGTDRSGTDVFGGEVLELDLIPSGAIAFGQDEIESMWPYVAVDDVTADQSHAVWVPQEPCTDLDADVTLVRVATDQLAFGYAGGEHGLATTGATTNLWPSNDPASTSAFEAETTVTVTRGVLDNTGLLRGIRVAGDATHGLKVTPTSFGASAGKANVILFARATSGTPSLSLAAMNASDVAVDAESLALTTSWKQFSVTLDWAGSASGYLRLRCASTFEVSSVGYASYVVAALIPSVIQDAGVLLSPVHAVVANEAPLQLNAEGELDITGVATLATPAASAIVGALTVDGAGDIDRRSLQCEASAVPRFVHYDGSASSATANGAAIDWSVEWRLRGRWNRQGIPSTTDDEFAGIVVEGSADSDVQDARSAAFSIASAPIDTFEIGASSGDSLDAYIRRFAVRARESRLG
jgi:hypothetical protein